MINYLQGFCGPGNFLWFLLCCVLQGLGPRAEGDAVTVASFSNHSAKSVFICPPSPFYAFLFLFLLQNGRSVQFNRISTIRHWQPLIWWLMQAAQQTHFIHSTYIPSLLFRLSNLNKRLHPFYSWPVQISWGKQCDFIRFSNMKNIKGSDTQLACCGHIISPQYIRNYIPHTPRFTSNTGSSVLNRKIAVWVICASTLLLSIWTVDMRQRCRASKTRAKKEVRWCSIKIKKVNIWRRWSGCMDFHTGHYSLCHVRNWKSKLTHFKLNNTLKLRIM